MAKSKSNWVQKSAVKLKVLMPMGVRLSPGETITLSEMYEDDAKVIKDNKAEVANAIKATERSIVSSNAIKLARGAKSQAIGTFKITKDPVKRREWARRIVVADQTIQTMRGVKTRLSATKDRLTMIMGDLELQYIEAEAKAAEMAAYASAGNSLRLAGEKLMHARSRANKLKLEYDNLEVTMEGAEKMASGLTDAQLLSAAENIAIRGVEDDEPEQS